MSNPMMKHTIETAPMMWCPRCGRYISDIAGHDNRPCTRNRNPK